MLSYTATIAIYAVSVACSFVVLLLSIYVRKAPKSLCFSYMSLAIFVFTMGYYFEITATSEASAIVATKLQYLGVCYVTPFLLLFTLEHCGKVVRRWFVAALMVIPTITLVLVQLWPMSTIYYKKVVFVADAVVPHLHVTSTVPYYVFFAYTHILAITAVVVVLRFYKRSTPSVRKQSRTLIVGIVISLAGNVANVFKISSWVLDLTPITLGLTCILLGYSIFRQGLYRIVPIARAQIVEHMSDGFILVDMQGRFVDANSAAMSLLPKLKNTSVGTQIDEIGELSWLNDASAQNEFSIVDSLSGAAKHYRVSQTVIRFQWQEICNCFMIFDITDTKQLLEEVSDLAERDSLTGLINRGAFYDKGLMLLQNEDRIGLLMMDLDYFKDVNDQYGHLQGDEVLKVMAETVGKCLRNKDILARYGGEEFCVLLPSLDADAALALAERIRKRVEACLFQSEKGVFNVTVSIGIAMYDAAKHDSFEALVADADAAMYAAKNAGRNTVALAGVAQK